MIARDRKTGSLAVLFAKLIELADYRTPRMVTERKVYKSMFGETGYYICPRCDITLEREFVVFCDRCGQKLDWRNYWKAKVRQDNTDMKELY